MGETDCQKRGKWDKMGDTEGSKVSDVILVSQHSVVDLFLRLNGKGNFKQNPDLETRSLCWQHTGIWI